MEDRRLNSPLKPISEDTWADLEISLWEVCKVIKDNHNILSDSEAALLHAFHLKEIIVKLKAATGDSKEVVIDHLQKTKLNWEQSLQYYLQHGRYPDEDRI